MNKELNHSIFFILLALFLLQGCNPSTFSSPGENSSTPESPSITGTESAISITTYPNYINVNNISSFPLSGACKEVTGIDIKMNSNILGAAICSGGAWSANVNASSVSDGSVTLVVTSTGSSTSLDSKSVNKDTTAPVAPTSIVDGDQIVSTSSSPVISWSAGSDVGSGLSKYQLRIVNSSNNEVVSWRDVGMVLTYSFTGLSLTATLTYKAEVRSVDNAGNVSTTTQGNGWYVTPPGWGKQAYLKAPNTKAGNMFGTSLALSGDTIVVGATGEKLKSDLYNQWFCG